MNREYTTHDVMEIIKKEDDNKPALVIPSCELAVDAFVSEQCLNLLVIKPKHDPDYYDGPSHLNTDCLKTFSLTRLISR